VPTSAARLGFVGRQQAGIEIGVDRHLLAGHGVQNEARRHFGHAPAPLVITTRLMIIRMKRRKMPTA
jgi:hypothetical protein